MNLVFNQVEEHVIFTPIIKEDSNQKTKEKLQHEAYH